MFAKPHVIANGDGDLGCHEPEIDRRVAECHGDLRIIRKKPADFDAWEEIEELRFTIEAMQEEIANLWSAIDDLGGGG